MICDDHPGFRQVLSLLLGTDAELQIVGEAADGREAIDLAARLRPDVLLLDVSMPEMDGLEALPHIREASPGTHVVMVTAFASDSVRRRAFDAGAREFVEKGADVGDIVERVKRGCSPVE